MRGVEGLAVRPAQVPMDPAGTIAWDRFSMHDAELYLAPQAPAEQDTIAELLTSGATGKPIGEGWSDGKVYAAPEAANSHLAIKTFAHPKDAAFLDGSKGYLPTLRANVLLEHGLEKVDQPWSAWRIRGARVLGALISKGAVEERQPSRWVMERVQQPNALLTNAMIRTVAPLPSPARRRAIYRAAMDQMTSPGHPHFGIDFDDIRSNLLIEQLPIGSVGVAAARRGVAAKIDVVHWSGLDF